MSDYKPTVPKEDIEEFIRKGELTIQHDMRVINEGKETKTYPLRLPESIRENAGRIDEALASIKICDPAIGSGAFPVGMMHEIVKARQILTPHIGDASCRGEACLAPTKDPERTAYNFKRHCIQESIYGVDIDPSAVDIAKLRLWLSLVVDEEDYEKIKPLPNLEYKIVCGNSLLGVEKDLLNHKLFAELEALKPQYFEETNPRKKNQLKQKIDSVIKQITKNDEHFDFEVYFSEVFHKKGGFDVVIANPPYVQIQKLRADTKDQLAKQGYQTFAKTADLYCLFYERGIAVLRAGGVLVFISSNKFLRAGYGAELRKFLHEQNELLTIIDFGELPVFDAGTDPCILMILKRQPQSEKITAAIVKDVFGIRNVRSTIEQIGFELDRNSLNSRGWTLEQTDTIDLLEKIHSTGKPLSKYVNGRFYRGILTGFNDAFVIDRTTRDRLIREDPKSAELIKSWLRGKDIRRWYADYQDLYVINIPSSANAQWPWSDKKGDHAENIFKKEYPTIFNHLKPYKTKLINRDDQGQYYWELRSCSYYEEFESPKIVYNETSKELHALFDDAGLYINKTGFIILSNNAKFLLGIMNSRLMDYLYRCEFPSWGDPWQGGRIQFRGDRMEKIPVAFVTKKQQFEIETQVDKILALKKEKSEADVSALEAKIDQMVYQLYELTDDEIAIVEGKS